MHILECDEKQKSRKDGEVETNKEIRDEQDAGVIPQQVAQEPEEAISEDKGKLKII